MQIVFASATELAAAIRHKQVSAVEALDAHLRQIDRHNPALNAVVTLDVERARKRAREADRALAQKKLWGSLHGVPYTLKDAFATAGVRTTVGFQPLADHVPREVSRSCFESSQVRTGSTPKSSRCRSKTLQRRR